MIFDGSGRMKQHKGFQNREKDPLGFVICLNSLKQASLGGFGKQREIGIIPSLQPGHFIKDNLAENSDCRDEVF